MPLMSSLLVGRGGAVLATASAMVSEVGVLGMCIACVAVVRRVRALAVWSSDYRSDNDQVGAPVVMCIVWTGGSEESAESGGYWWWWWEVVVSKERRRRCI